MQESPWASLNIPPAGRLKAACDLVAHHLPTDVKTELVSTYEYANPSSKLYQHIELLTVSRPWTFT